MQEGYRLEKSASVEDAVVLDIMQKLIDGAGQKYRNKIIFTINLVNIKSINTRKIKNVFNNRYI